MAQPARDFIAYYRVSTDRQGASGLGLDAQRQAARHHAGNGQLIAEYTEIESGRRHTNRPQLLAALTESQLLLQWKGDNSVDDAQRLLHINHAGIG